MAKRRKNMTRVLWNNTLRRHRTVADMVDGEMVKMNEKNPPTKVTHTNGPTEKDFGEVATNNFLTQPAGRGKEAKPCLDTRNKILSFLLCCPVFSIDDNSLILTAKFSERA